MGRHRPKGEIELEQKQKECYHILVPNKEGKTVYICTNCGKEINQCHGLDKQKFDQLYEARKEGTMSNMGYCRFRNTLSDLRECCDNWNEVLSGEEEKARADLLNLCRIIIADYGDEDED